MSNIKNSNKTSKHKRIDQKLPMFAFDLNNQEEEIKQKDKLSLFSFDIFGEQKDKKEEDKKLHLFSFDVNSE